MTAPFQSAYSDPSGVFASHLVSLENSCATSYFDLGLNARVCFIVADFPPSDAMSHFAFLTPCLAAYLPIFVKFIKSIDFTDL
jgi:hypothetical protein